MNTKAQLLGLAVAMAVSGTAFADNHGGEPKEQPAPKLYGTLAVGQEALSGDKDDGFRVTQATVGVKGSLGYDQFKAIYQVEVELADLANPDNASDSNEARVRTARVIIPTEKAGTFVLGRTASGVRGDLYGHLDIFDNTEVYNSASGNYTQSNNLTGQVLYAPGVAAWKTPSYNGVYAVPAVLSINDSNGESVDAYTVRVVYKKDGLKLGGSIVTIDDSLLPGDKKYDRTALAASYKADRWQLGGTLEDNKDHPSGDFQVGAVAGIYKVTPKTDLKLGYFKKDHDNDALDNAAVIANASYTFGSGKGKSARLYVEHEAHDIEENDKTTAGVVLSF